MPDFIAPAQLPTGLAEQLLQIKSQQNPWAAVAQNFGNQVGNAAQQYGQKSAQTQQQQQALQLAIAQGLINPNQAGPRLPNGQQGPTQIPTQEAFPRGISQQSLGELMAAKTQQQKLQEQSMIAANREAGLNNRDMVTVTPKMAASPEFQKLGLTPGSTIPKQTADTLIRPKSGTTVTADAKKMIAQDLADGKLSPSQLPQILGRGGGSDRADIYSMAKKINPKFNAEEGQTAYMAKQRGAEKGATTQAGTLQIIGPMSKSVDDILNEMEPLINKLSPTSLEIANKAYRYGLKETSDPDANELLGLMTSATALQASIFKNGQSPTDTEMKMASEYFSKGVNPKGFPGVRKAINVENTSRIKRASENFLPGSDANKEAQGSQDKKSDTKNNQIPDGRVAVKSPDGKIGHIPQDQLKEALSSGYVQVE
jgi:hypothetical protein